MCSETSEPTQQHAIDPSDLEATLRVLREVADTDQTHPDFISVRGATAGMFKAAKKARRLAREPQLTLIVCVSGVLAH